MRPSAEELAGIIAASSKLEEAIAGLHVPQPNRFIPSDVSILTNTEQAKEKNTQPTKIILNEAVTLWLLIDQVYLKPRTRLDIVLHIAPQTARNESSAFLSSPEDIAMFQVVCDCIREKINKEVGYEANLAHADYSIKKFCDVGIHFSFESYSDKLLDFAALCIALMLKMRDQDID